MFLCFKRQWLLGLAFSLSWLQVQAQAASTLGENTRRNSPYSRFGMGDMFNTGYTPNLSMGGGLTGTYQSNYDYNLQNPASLGSIETTNFHLGMFYQHSRLREPSTGQQQGANDGNLGYLGLAFPITRSWDIEKDTIRRRLPIQWGMAIGMMPHSTVGYDVQVVRNLPEIGEVEYRYRGTGTRIRLNWGNGWRYKGFSAGANLGFVFGKTNFNQQINFLDSAYNFAYNEERIGNQYVRALVWDFGLQYRHTLQKSRHPRSKQTRDLFLILGAYSGGGGAGQTFTDQQLRRFGTFYTSDTLRSEAEQEAEFSLPLSWGAGLSIGRQNNWRLGLNFEQQAWASAVWDSREPLVNAYRFSLGGEWQPMNETISEKLRYRTGLFYAKDPRSIGGQTLQQYGITFGLGVPVIISRIRPPGVAFVNLGLELGYMGHRSLIEDYYIQVRLGISVHDGGWFVRSKYR